MLYQTESDSLLSAQNIPLGAPIRPKTCSRSYQTQNYSRLYQTQNVFRRAPISDPKKFSRFYQTQNMFALLSDPKNPLHFFPNQKSFITPIDHFQKPKKQSSRTQRSQNAADIPFCFHQNHRAQSLQKHFFWRGCSKIRILLLLLPADEQMFGAEQATHKSEHILNYLPCLY